MSFYFSSKFLILIINNNNSRMVKKNKKDEQEYTEEGYVMFKNLIIPNYYNFSKCIILLFRTHNIRKTVWKGIQFYFDFFFHSITSMAMQPVVPHIINPIIMQIRVLTHRTVVVAKAVAKPRDCQRRKLANADSLFLQKITPQSALKVEKQKPWLFQTFMVEIYEIYEI